MLIESVDQLRKEVIAVVVGPHPMGKENRTGCIDVGGCHQLAEAAVNSGVDVAQGVADDTELLFAMPGMGCVFKVPHQVPGAVGLRVYSIKEIPIGLLD